MDRVTFANNHCDICAHRGYCEDVCNYWISYGDRKELTRKVWDRLKAIEDILGDSYELEELKQRWGYMGLIGKTVYGIRRRSTTRNRKGTMRTYDRAVGSPWLMERYPEECYVAERICVRSDLAKLGSTVFLTREEAEAAIGGDHNA